MSFRLFGLVFSLFLIAYAPLGLCAPARVCILAHSIAESGSNLSILPTFSRISPFNGTIHFQTSDGQVIPYNMFKHPKTFLTGLDENRPVQQGYDINRLVVPEFAANIYVNPREVPRGSKLLPVDADGLYEEAVGDIFFWNSERREREKKKYLEDDGGQGQLEHLGKNVLVPDFIRPIFPRIEMHGDIVFVQLKVQFSESTVHSENADISRAFLDSYFTALQKVYRENGDSRLGKAIKLLDSWIQVHRNHQDVRVYMIYDRDLWNLTMMQLSHAVQAAELRNADSYSRTRYFHSYIRRFYPIGGMMATFIGDRVYELGRNFNNPEADPAQILFPSGLSPQSQKLTRANQSFYRWILQDLPPRTLLWARAFSAVNARRFRQNGFQEPTNPSPLYLQSKEESEKYWHIEKSWIMEQERDLWLQALLESGL